MANGGNTNAQYIHRNQNNTFVSTYMASVKKTIYIENPNVDITALTNGLDDEFQRLMQEGEKSRNHYTLVKRIVHEMIHPRIIFSSA